MVRGGLGLKCFKIEIDTKRIGPKRIEYCCDWAPKKWPFLSS
jgi:hypothetical protein